MTLFLYATDFSCRLCHKSFSLKSVTCHSTHDSLASTFVYLFFRSSRDNISNKNFNENTSKTSEERMTIFRIQTLVFFFSYSLLGDSKADFFDLNYCTISCNISSKKQTFWVVARGGRGRYSLETFFFLSLIFSLLRSFFDVFFWFCIRVFYVFFLLLIARRAREVRKKHEKKWKEMSFKEKRKTKKKWKEFPAGRESITDDTDLSTKDVQFRKLILRPWNSQPVHMSTNVSQLTLSANRVRTSSSALLSRNDRWYLKFDFYSAPLPVWMKL